MFSTIVVGWVDTESADAAVEWAAGRAGTTLVRLVTVLPGQDKGSDYLSPTAAEAAVRVRLIERADKARERHPDTHFETEVIRGSVLDELNRLSTEGTLLVVGFTPRSQRTADFGWSIATRVAGSHHPGTVAVVPREYSPSGRTGVVVGLDTSSGWDEILRVAMTEAVELMEELQIVHAWTAPPYWQDGYAPDLGNEDSIQKVHEHILDDAVNGAREASELDIRGTLVNDAAPEALRTASRNAVELVIGNHSSRGIRRFLLGSVSHALLRDLQCPTVVVRS